MAIILRTSSPELKKAFREAERLQEKIIKLKTHLKFNKTCLIYIHVYQTFIIGYGYNI